MSFPVIIAASSVAVVVLALPSVRQDISTTTLTTTVTSTKLVTITDTTSQSSRSNSAAKSPPVEMHASTRTDTSSHIQTTTPSSMVLSDACFPKATDNQPNLSYPCNGAEYILQECAFGFAKGHDPNPTSNSTQRLCACGSQIFNEWDGCAECLQAHRCHMLTQPVVQQISSSYCAASATPTHDILHAMLPLISGLREAKEMKTVSVPSQGSVATTYHFGPTVTGPAALQVPQMTARAGKTVLPVATSSGQLVPLQKTSATVSLQGPQDLTATISSYAVTPSSSPKAENSNTGVRTSGAAIAAVIGLAALALML